MKKNCDLHLRLNESEKNAIISEAKKANLTLSEFVLRAALGLKISQVDRKERFITLRAITAEMNKIGSNINQIAAQINLISREKVIVRPELLHRLEADISKIKELYQNTIQAIEYTKI